ncbi:hypothetical protein CEP54_015183 [Fusarium duplospermum]|uniref:Uncharacterized protein n=1 Tax=Fusarium duplospermum TaxID=1325734 RepID=A0A428NR06_9HYPO|nr:hypothetical protein CEP54_015183 [Fusarium duplospermum]
MAKAKQVKRVADPRRDVKIFNSATQRMWSFPLSYRKVLRRIEEIQQGKRSGSDLVILDDEYSPSSRQLWEFAIIERVSGRTLINTTIEHQNGIDHNEVKPYPFMKWLSRSKASTVYSPCRLSIDSMTVHQVASKLKEVGITPNTIILVYQVSTTDLRLLRELLESSGYFDILPPDENCVPMLQPLRENLSKGQPAHRRICLSLENLFPVMFPRHSLIGLNHQALVDC